MPALLALGLWLVGPYLDLLAALLATDILGLGSPNLCASWATFLKHVVSILPAKKKIYDSHHIRCCFYSLMGSFTASVISILKL